MKLFKEHIKSNKERSLRNAKSAVSKNRSLFSYCNLLIASSLLLAFSSCTHTQISEEKEVVTPQSDVVTLTEAQYKNAGIEIGKIEMKNVYSVLKLNGKVDVPPQNIVSVSVPLGGYLTSTKLLPGMHVVKGEIIAVMEDPQYIQLQQDYLSAKAQFVFLESEYLRQQELNESKAASDKVFEQAKASYQTQNILVKSLEQKLHLIGVNPNKLTANTIRKNIFIYAPINGFVSSVNVNIGKYVLPSDVLFELINPDDIHLALNVFDKDVNKLAIGQKVLAYTNNNPGRKYECKIILINKNLRDDNATQVHCHFKDFDKELLPGMFMNAVIELSGGNTSVLPDDAIVRFGNKNYVFIEKGNRTFEMLEVQIGNAENGFTEVVDADKFFTAKIVVKGAYPLLMVLKNTDEE